MIKWLFEEQILLEEHPGSYSDKVGGVKLEEGIEIFVDKDGEELLLISNQGQAVDHSGECLLMQTNIMMLTGKEVDILISTLQKARKHIV